MAAPAAYIANRGATDYCHLPTHVQGGGGGGGCLPTSAYSLRRKIGLPTFVGIYTCGQHSHNFTCCHLIDVL